jgi:hypothetical protein
MLPTPGRHKKSDPVLKHHDGVLGNSDEARRIINLCSIMKLVVDIFSLLATGKEPSVPVI